MNDSNTNATKTTKPMIEKICLVSGATAGIGKATATALASQGAEVVITGRNQQKAENTIQQIISETRNPAVKYLLADFSDLQQVRQLAAAFKESYAQLDVLVNNAGVFINSRIETPYGVEVNFLINHLAPFLLTNLLLDVLKASPSARIVNVASEGHKQASLDFDDLEFKRGFLGMRAYGRSKLANILFTYELARRLENPNVTVNALHPGYVATDIWKTSFPKIGQILKWAIGKFFLTPEQGADNSIYLASSPDVEGITGKYFVKRQPVRSSPISYDEKVAKQLWEVSERLTS